MIGAQQPTAGCVSLEAIRAMPAWLVWRREQHAGEAKARKVPYWAGGGRRSGTQGSPEDRQQLVTFEAAQAAATRRGMDGVGLALMPEWGVTAVDFDNCVRDGAPLADVERAVAGTYAEFSPSGTGVRALVQGDLGNHKDHGEPFGFELFASKGFVTLTGRPLPVTELTDCVDTIAPPSAELLALAGQRFGRAEPAQQAASASDEPRLGLSTQQLADALAALDPSMGHDPWLKVGMALHHETGGEGFELWDQWSAGGVQYPGADALRGRWESFGRQNGRPTTAHYLAQLAATKGHVMDLITAVADDFDVVEPSSAAAQDKPLKFKLWSVRELLEQKPPRWIVKDVAPQAELMVIFGESGSGKSFVVLDMFAAVARGAAWLGQATRQGRVVYVVAEGRAGFGNRVKAYCRSQDVDVDQFQQHFAVIADTPNLLQRDDAAEIVRSVAAAGGASVVVVDTLAQTTPGANENAAEDMGKALANCKAIHRATGALVVLVHHTGKDQSRGARGWSGLKAAADAEIEISRTVAGRAIRVSKQKDGEDGRVWGFELDVVPVGADDDGGTLTSCVIREVAPPLRQQIARLGKWQRAALDAVAELGGTGAGAKEAEIITAAIQVEAPAQGKRDRRAEYVRTALAELVERCVLEVADGAYCIA